MGKEKGLVTRMSPGSNPTSATDSLCDSLSKSLVLRLSGEI